MSVRSIRARQEQLRREGRLPGAKGIARPSDPVSDPLQVVKVVYPCPWRPGVWMWAVRQDGTVVDSGKEKSREAAERAAEEARQGVG